MRGNITHAIIPGRRPNVIANHTADTGKTTLATFPGSDIISVKSRAMLGIVSTMTVRMKRHLGDTHQLYILLKSFIYVEYKS